MDLIINDLDGYYGSLDAVLLSGDFVVHGLSARESKESDWPAMKQTIQAVVTKVTQKFPTSYIIPCIGNNDVEQHYQAPQPENKT